MLCEHYRIARRDIDTQVAPRGRGSAANWVTQQYPGVLRLARSKRSQEGLGFLVIIDGDNVGVDKRREQLRAAAGQSSSDEPRVAVLVPTRNIETWVRWLTGYDVNELQDYPLSDEEFANRLPGAVEAWGMPRDRESLDVPSLSRARQAMSVSPFTRK